jgi:hypothetical protein
MGKPVSSMIHASIGPWRSIGGSTSRVLCQKNPSLCTSLHRSPKVAHIYRRNRRGVALALKHDAISEHRIDFQNTYAVYAAVSASPTNLKFLKSDFP